MENTIKLVDALRILDEIQTPEGKPIYHDLAFIKFSKYNPKENGALCRLKKVQKIGLRYSVKDSMRRGVQDVFGNVKSFHIRLLIEIDKQVIVW